MTTTDNVVAPAASLTRRRTMTETEARAEAARLNQAFDHSSGRHIHVASQAAGGEWAVHMVINDSGRPPCDW